MPKRSSKTPDRDENVAAADAVRRLTGQDEPEVTHDGKNAAAVALGRLGGKKGGPARAAKLSKKRRREIAEKAAEARWAKSRESAG